MNKLKKATAALAVCIAAVGTQAGPELSYAGYLDSDVWADMTGSYMVNSELDLGMTLKFSDNVSANVYVTALSGQIPAGTGNPADRWASMSLDGLDITYESPIGTFSIGDLVYQHGKFGYYYYKRLSMITPESFARGVRYSNSFGPVTQTVMAGVADIDYNTADALGATSVSLGEEQSVTAVYGFRGSSNIAFRDGSDIFAGLEYAGSFGDALSVKANVGYVGVKGVERSSVVILLAEPGFSFGNFAVATSVFALIDVDTIGAASLFKLGDEFYAYVEPGYTLSDLIAVGLPLEYHAASLRDVGDGAFWVVPTLYVYPSENVEWWTWGQTVLPKNGGSPGYGIGTEIIVSF